MKIRLSKTTARETGEEPAETDDHRPVLEELRGTDLRFRRRRSDNRWGRWEDGPSPQATRRGVREHNYGGIKGPTETVFRATVAALRIYDTKSVSGTVTTPMPRLTTMGTVEGGIETVFSR